jgi:hypothetical protein
MGIMAKITWFGLFSDTLFWESLHVQFIFPAKLIVLGSSSLEDGLVLRHLIMIG